jgi:hypothetical protein
MQLRMISADGGKIEIVYEMTRLVNGRLTKRQPGTNQVPNLDSLIGQS